MALPRVIGIAARLLARSLVVLVVVLVLVVLAGLAALQSAWGQERIRRLAVDQANRFLTATLDIGRLEGSLLGGVTLHDVRLTRDGTDIVAIEQVDVAYSLRQFFGEDIRIRRLRLVRPRILIAREADGRWNLGALVRPRAPAAPGSGRRPVLLQSIEIDDGDIQVRDPLSLGIARAPQSYKSLEAALSFTLAARGWFVEMERVAWTGESPAPERVEVSGVVGTDPDGWRFERLDVRTPRSQLVVSGHVDRTATPSGLDLQVAADRFAFQEWAGVLGALENIAVEATFDGTLQGSVRQFVTDITLAGDGGGVDGTFRIDTTPPGWRVAGEAVIERLDLARWLNRPDRPSDISGDTSFELSFVEGARFPIGAWTFEGSHAAFLEYEASDVQATGRLTRSDVLLDAATATAYGANLRLGRGTIGIDTPFPFTFRGTALGLDLRQLPEPVPIPKVESVLAMDFDVNGQFVEPFIDGQATFRASRFLGAGISPGAVGAVATSGGSFRYSGEGEVRDFSIERVASALEIGWLSDSRYHGMLTGRFAVDGSGTGAGLALTSRGHIEEATLFGGTLSSAGVTLEIADGSLSATYDGRIDNVNPALALADERFEATITGTGRAGVRVANLLIESPDLHDYALDTDLRIEQSTISDVPLESALVQVQLERGVATGSIEARAPILDGRISGSFPLDESGTAALTFDIARADLQRLGARVGREMSGTLVTSGRVSGALDGLRTDGTLAASEFAIDRVRVLGIEGTYNASTSATGRPALLTADFTGDLTFVGLGEETIDRISGSASYAEDRVTTRLELAGIRGASGVLEGTAQVSPDWTSATISALAFGLNESVWEFVPTAPPPVVVWTAEGVTLEPMAFTPRADASQRLSIAGTWRVDGAGQLDLTAEGVEIAALAAALGQPDSYGGLINLDATITGTTAQPLLTGDLLITNGRVRQLSYEQLFGRIVYINGMFEVGIRLDQAPGVWLTASGAFPLGLLDRTQPEQPMHVAIASTPISLGLVEGLTNVVTDVTGQVELNISAVGTGHDPRFTGLVRLMDAGFLVTSTGARYQRGSGTVTLTRDRMTVDALRIHDMNDRALDVQGSVGTEELQFQDLQLDVVAREFEVLRNQYGGVDIDARLTLRGRADAPLVAGTLTITDGELQVDRILDRMLFSPYAVEAAPEPANVDALSALNPWERLALDIALDIPNTLRMVGDNVQVATGTPLGVGNIDLRVAGNLFLRKQPGGELVVIGGLDQLTGRYAFQGRRFDLDPSSTVAFSGDLDPELLITVTRVISGVETRVTIAGRLSEPELQLASNPPLDPTDILSLIVFNTSVNQLSLEQQEQLAVRAGTLAAGFLTAPLVTALERTLGLDVLEIEAAATGARVTIGDEIAPGLVARFSRQFGDEEYDEAAIEYSLSRLFRIRATFSDAASVVRSPFRRVERAGIDLLLFFSF